MSLVSRIARNIVSKIPYGKRFIERYNSYLFHKNRDLFHKKLRNKSSEDIFEQYYRENFWGNSESVSGDGSTVAYTANIRKHLPEVFAQYKIKTLLDAPCGDFNWFRLVERDASLIYIGGDIVEQIIDRNNSIYKNFNTTFIKIDITKDELPACDLWLCRDVLFHFSNEDVFAALKNFSQSAVPYLLTSSHTDCRENTDIPTGSFRLLNLELPPFSLPEPLLSVEDFIDGYPVRKLCLWQRKTIAESLR